jgi:hypothetical protein
MWFDGPLFAGQAPFGAVGLLHPPIIAALLVIASMLTVMVARYSGA